MTKALRTQLLVAFMCVALLVTSCCWGAWPSR